jgi:hypothetical protein
LEGFVFSYNQESEYEDVYANFVGSFYFNGELYKVESTIGLHNAYFSKYWIALLNWTKPEQIKVGADVALRVRIGHSKSDTDAIAYDFLKGATAVPRTSDILVANEFDNKIILRGVRASGEPVGVDFYNSYGEFIVTEYYTVVD